MATAIQSAAEQAWPPFVLVAGLLLIGEVVAADGLYAALGTRIERIGGGPVVLLATLLGLEAAVTAVLNLDTAVVFLTPIIIHAARQRDCDERPFLYGALFMANGASLLLPRLELDEPDRARARAVLGRPVRTSDVAALACGRGHHDRLRRTCVPASA